MLGSTFAHYRITSKLGEGGMGEVYRATDGRLNREVAVRTFDVTRDGSRIIAVSVPDENVPRQIEVVTDWTSGLSRRLTPRK